MQNFMNTLLICSVTMSALALFYMAVTPLLIKRYSVTSRYYTWLVIVIGLIIPFRPQFSNAIVKVNIPSNTVVSNIQIGNGTPVTAPFENALPFALSSISLWQIAMVVWLTGMILFFAYHVIKHHRFLKVVSRWSKSITDEQVLTLIQDLKTEMRLTKNIDLQFCDSIGSPMMLGFVNPRILLPKADFAKEELYFILKHELVHYQRKDLWYQCLVLIATAIHWFNPIIYLMARAINIQCELSCDEKVVYGTSADNRLFYSETIIGVVKYQSKLKTSLSTNFYGGKKGMKKRIYSIMDMSKKKIGLAVLCGVLILTLGTGFVFAVNIGAQKPQTTNVAVADTNPQQLPYTPTNKELLTEYGKYGIEFDKNGKMLFNNELVRYFWDGVYLDVDQNESSAKYEYLDKSGTIDVHTTRTMIDNGDGSINPFGNLTGIVAYSQVEFDKRDLTKPSTSPPTAVADENSNQNSGGKTFAQIFDTYSEYGITYEEISVDGQINRILYYNGQKVQHFVDESEKGIFFFDSTDGGEINVYTLYDNKGNLIGVEKR